MKFCIRLPEEETWTFITFIYPEIGGDVGNNSIDEHARSGMLG